MKKRVKFMVTAFRDGFQSVYGARVFTKDFLPAVEAAANAGINHFEAGGGARFQSLYFYCNEDAFDMMDQFRETVGPDVNLQTLARGVNVVGLDSQPRDIIDLHARMFKKHGISTIRNFDALNDVNNLIYSGSRIVEAGLNHEVVVTMMALPPEAEGAHTPEFYMDVLRDILDAGISFDSVCFKDASGTSVPQTVYETVRQARQMLGEETHITFHSHETAGINVLQYKAALDGGADQIDLSMAPVSGGTSQVDVITMWHALRDTDYDLGVDIKKVQEAEEVFKECMADYFTPPEAKAVEPLIPFSPMPGGALTANTQMMRDNGILDKYSEVAAAMGEVIEKGGYGTSVTPVSQFYFQQAFNNVMIGPWKKIAEGYGKMVLGYFGKTPRDPDPDIVTRAGTQLGLEPTTKKVVDINDEDPSKGIEPAKKMLEAENLALTDENIFIAATCKEKGITFLKGEAKSNVRKVDKSSEAEATGKGEASGETAEAGETAEGGKAGGKGTAPSAYTVTVNDTAYKVEFEEGKAIVNGTPYSVNVKPHPESGAAGSGGPEGEIHNVEAPMPGLILRINKKEGEHVEEGELIMVMEAMKMETEIHAPASGTIREISVKQGEQLKTGELLAVIS